MDHTHITPILFATLLSSSALLSAQDATEPPSDPIDDPTSTVTYEPTLVSDSQGSVLVGPAVLNGDWDGSGQRNLTDLYLLARYLFESGEPAKSVLCLPRVEGAETVVFATTNVTVENGDIDGSGQINITDLFRLAKYLFGDGSQEPEPIGCESSAL